LRAEEGQPLIEAMTPDRIVQFLVWFLVFLFSLTLHEAAHALLARLGGDDTAYLGGQVSLNPLPHIRREPLGTLLMPLISFFMLGWMMGWASTPYDPHWAHRHPRRQALMSLAGPAANLLIAVTAFALLRLLLVREVLVVPDEGATYARLADPAPGFGDASLLWSVAAVLSIALSLNVLLCLFNLLPIPPMDGSGVVHGLFPDSAGRLIESLRGNPMMGLLGLLAAWRIFPYVYRPAISQVVDWLYAGL
jgi:Zn-dependent protease